ncbi:hypothetical protein M23134_01794, partial [Microscilla marina ATCC 23134]
YFVAPTVGSATPPLCWPLCFVARRPIPPFLMPALP